jgi:N-acetylmuramoyl-L-alanine amidase
MPSLVGLPPVDADKARIQALLDSALSSLRAAVGSPETLSGEAPHNGDSAKQEPAAEQEDADSVAFKKALRCLALNIYHEARSESDIGQVAVAAVTLNRVASESFPDSVCAVVKQGGQKRHNCQFSWWCDGRDDTPKDKQAWQKAMRISRESLRGTEPDPTEGALYYHTRGVNPRWSRAFKRTVRIGQHVFYRPKRSLGLRLAGIQ